MHYRLFRWFPKSALSRLKGRVADRVWPGWLLKAVIRCYVRIYRIDMGQFQAPPEGFATFNEFFTRPLRPDARPVEPAPDRAVSPVDACVSACGTIARGRLIQAKGLDYGLGELLAGGAEEAPYEGGAFLTLYLSPRDYHRIHSPCAGRAVRYAYTPGELWSVSPSGVRSVPGLFTRNERLLTVLDTAWGEVLLIAVGALVVGRIKVAYAAITSNLAGAQPSADTLAKPYPLAKGQELGRFELGSTVILLFPRGAMKLDDLTAGQSLLLGQGIGTMRKRKA